MDQSGLKFEPAAETKDQSFITTGMVQLVQPQPASPTAAASDEATGSVQQPSGEIFQTFDSVEEASRNCLAKCLSRSSALPLGSRTMDNLRILTVSTRSH